MLDITFRGVFKSTVCNRFQKPVPSAESYITPVIQCKKENAAAQTQGGGDTETAVSADFRPHLGMT